MPQISFARDIRPLFRDVDISHMERHGIKLDDYTFMSDPDNANKVFETLSSHEGDPPAMPPGGPYWTGKPGRLWTSCDQKRLKYSVNGGGVRCAGYFDP